MLPNEIKDIKDFKAYLQESFPIRQEKYKLLMSALDTAKIEYGDMFMLLDWINAQTIAHFIKDKKQIKLICKILSKSTSALAIMYLKTDKIEGKENEVKP